MLLARIGIRRVFRRVVGTLRFDVGEKVEAKVRRKRSAMIKPWSQRSSAGLVVEVHELSRRHSNRPQRRQVCALPSLRCRKVRAVDLKLFVGHEGHQSDSDAVPLLIELDERFCGRRLKKIDAETCRKCWLDVGGSSPQHLVAR